MKKKHKLLAIIGVGILTVGAFLSGHYAGAASAMPGSEGDPLITLSYLESRLGTAGGGAEVVQLAKGKNLTGEPGTGIVVVKGSVTAAGENLVDVTEGSLTEEDTSLFLYHNYIAAERGSGCEALSTCTLLVFGDYTIR